MPAVKHARAEAAADREARYRRLLAGAGLRVTPARLLVLQTMEVAQAALSHADIEALLPEPLDRVTLYRTLDSCAEAGLLARSVGADRIGRFALLGAEGRHDRHPHFHCDDCGRVYCLPGRQPRPPAVPEGFAIEGVDMHVHGHCPSCAAPSRGSARPVRSG